MPFRLEEFRRPILLGFLAALIVAFFSIFVPNQYRSVARILPVEARTGLGGLGNLASAAAAFGVSLPSADGGDTNAVEILQSRWLQERLLTTQFRFKKRSWRFGREKEVQESLYDFLEAKNMDRAIKMLQPMLEMNRDIKSKVIFLAVETKSPTLSQVILKEELALLETFIKQQNRTRGGARASFAEARLAEARKEVASAEDEFRRFLDVNRNYLTSSEPSIRLKGSRLEAELRLRQQLVVTLAISKEQALMEEKNDMPILNVLDGGNLPIEKSRPARSNWVLAAFFLVAVGTWALSKKGWILQRLLENGDTNSPVAPQKEM